MCIVSKDPVHLTYGRILKLFCLEKNKKTNCDAKLVPDSPVKTVSLYLCIIVIRLYIAFQLNYIKSAVHSNPVYIYS